MFVVRTEIITPYESREVILGTRLELKCEVTNDPSIEVTWLWTKNGGGGGVPIDADIDQVCV